MRYTIKFTIHNDIIVDFPNIERHDIGQKIDCDYFTLTLDPACDFVRLSAWIYKENGPVNVSYQYEDIEDFEYTDNRTGFSYGLNAFNDLFWKKSSKK